MKKSNMRRLAAFAMTLALLMGMGAAFADGEAATGGSAKVELIDSDGGQALKAPGAVYALYLYTGTSFDEWANFATEELYGEYVSDENGVILAENLPAGEYRWELVAEPEGYNTTALYKNYLSIGPGAEASNRVYCFKTTAPEEFTTERIAYVGGYPDGTVRPKDNITRAETAVILHRLLSDEVKAQYNSDKNTYTDLKDGAWYMTAIATLKNMGVIKQNGPEFEPSRPITRGEFVEWIYYFGGKEYYGEWNFTDHPGMMYQHQRELWDKIEIVGMHGWISGYPDGSFDPDGLITRAEMMTIFNRMLERMPASVEELPADMKVWSDNSNPGAWFYLAVQEATSGIAIS